MEMAKTKSKPKKKTAKKKASKKPTTKGEAADPKDPAPKVPENGSKSKDSDAPDFSALKEIFDEAAREEANTLPALQWIDVECPHCGENFEVVVDPQEAGQDMVQDCQVCCRPIELSVEVEEDDLSVEAYQS